MYAGWENGVNGRSCVDRRHRGRGQGGARHDVIETLRQNDRSVERTADYLEVPLDRIEACLRYYADYGDEIDQWIDRARAIAEREEARWHRRGEALA